MYGASDNRSDGRNLMSIHERSQRCLFEAYNNMKTWQDPLRLSLKVLFAQSFSAGSACDSATRSGNWSLWPLRNSVTFAASHSTSNFMKTWRRTRFNRARPIITYDARAQENGCVTYVVVRCEGTVSPWKYGLAAATLHSSDHFARLSRVGLECSRSCWHKSFFSKKWLLYLERPSLLSTKLVSPLIWWVPAAMTNRLRSILYFCVSTTRANVIYHARQKRFTCYGFMGVWKCVLACLWLAEEDSMICKSISDQNEWNGTHWGLNPAEFCHSLEYMRLSNWTPVTRWWYRYPFSGFFLFTRRACTVRGASDKRKYTHWEGEDGASCAHHTLHDMRKAIDIKSGAFQDVPIKSFPSLRQNRQWDEENESSSLSSEH